MKTPLLFALALLFVACAPKRQSYSSELRSEEAELGLPAPVEPKTFPAPKTCKDNLFSMTISDELLTIENNFTHVVTKHSLKREGRFGSAVKADEQDLMVCSTKNPDAPLAQYFEIHVRKTQVIYFPVIATAAVAPTVFDVVSTEQSPLPKTFASAKFCTSDRLTMGITDEQLDVKVHGNDKVTRIKLTRNGLVGSPLKHNEEMIVACSTKDPQNPLKPYFRIVLRQTQVVYEPVNAAAVVAPTVFDIVEAALEGPEQIDL